MLLITISGQGAAEDFSLRIDNEPEGEKFSDFKWKTASDAL
jgi:hypothetical protein